MTGSTEYQLESGVLHTSVCVETQIFQRNKIIQFCRHLHLNQPVYVQ